MSSLYKRYFELQPINNITEFSADNGVDIINFIIPPVAGAILPTQDLMFTGTLQINSGTNTPYVKGSTQAIGIDNVGGVHGMIQRVELTSRNGNVLLEQRLNYSLCNKVKSGNLDNQDLKVGRLNNQVLVGDRVLNCSQFLRRSAVGNDGYPFSIQLNTGLMKDNLQQIALEKIGGIEIRIQLNPTAQFLMNIDTGAATLLDANATYTLKNVRLFGRYNYVDGGLLNQLQGVQFKQMSNQMNVIQSSNDTTAFSPQVNSLDKIVYIFQPNNDTKNNFNSNGTNTNQLVGLKNYKVSRNGINFPYDFRIDINESLGDLEADSSKEFRYTGDSEAAYHFITAVAGNYPPPLGHSLVNNLNVARANADAYGVNGTNNAVTNLFGNNLDGVATSYQYGFAGYATPMTTDLVQLQAESQVKTNNNIVPSAIRDQTQTQNALIIYNSTLNYSNLSVAK